MNHCVKLICAACLSAMIFFSCSTHKDKNCSSIDSQSYKESSFPVFEDLSLSSSLSAVPLSANDLSLDSLLVVNATEAECSFKNSHSEEPESSLVSSHSCSESSSDHIEEYFNLPSPTVDISKYKTVCEGDNPPLHGGNQSGKIDNPPLWGGNHTSDEGDNPPLHGGNQSVDNPPLHGGNQPSQTDNPPLRGGNQSFQTDNPPVVNTPIQQFSITDEEIEMLKYIVEQETRGGSYRHKCIVTNVVLNRVKDSRFPNTVKGVLLQKNQFSSTWNYYQKRNKPDKSTVNAVNDVLNSRVEDESNGALYFHSMSSDGWFSSLSFVMEMEGHRFFK